MKSIIAAVIFAASAVAVPAFAATITYTYTSTFTGTNNGNPFTIGATFTGIGDTNNFTTLPQSGYPAVVLTSFTAVADGPYEISTPFVFGFNSTDGLAGFLVDDANAFTFSSAALVGYDGVSNITVATDAYYTVANFTTDRGNIVLTGQDIGVFTASVASVPEPAAWALMIGGFAMTGVAMRRRKTSLAA